MKTIEERADEFIGHPREVDEDLTTKMARDAYIQGAKEQRDIDIEKAWKWIKDIIFPYISYYTYTDCIDRKDAFREFMEK